MAVLNQEVARLSASIPEQGIADAIWTPGGMLRGLPFFEGNGTLNHVYNREGSLPIVGPIPLGGAVPQADVTVTQQSVAYKWFGADLLFDRRTLSINSNIQDAKAALAIKAAKSLRRQIESYLYIGDSSADANQFDGLLKLFPGAVQGTQHAQTRGAAGDAANGGALAWSDLYTAWDERVHDDAKENGFWMSNAFVMGKIRDLLMANFSTPEEKMDPNFGLPALMLMGKPILLNNYMPKTETRGSNVDCSSLFYCGVGEEGLHGRLPLGGNEMIVLEDLGRVPGYVQDVVRVMFGMSLVVKSELYVARICGIR